MTTADLTRKISDYVVERFLDGDDNGFTTQTELLESGIIDSFSIFELIQFVTETTKIQIPEDKLAPENLQSVEHIVKLVSNLS